MFFKLQSVRGREGKAEEEKKKGEGTFSLCYNTWALFSLLKYSELPDYFPTGSSGRALTSVRQSQNHFLTFCTVHYISGKGIRKGYIFNILLCRFRALVKIHTTLSFNSVNSGRHGRVQLLSAAARFSVSFLGG